MNSKSRSLFLLTVIFTLVILNAMPAQAQDGAPPPANGAWSEVINEDGSIDYDNLTDGGVVTQPADWMPTNPFNGEPIEAEYHVYTTPTGNQILFPSATTLFFMASNANESGLLAAASTLGTSGLSTVNSDNGNVVGIASLGSIYGALIGNQEIGLPTAANVTDFFNQVLSGQENIWSLNPEGLRKFLDSLSDVSLSDQNLYTYMLLYTPDLCGSSPVGCTPEQLALLASLIPDDDIIDPTLTPPPAAQCPAPQVISGRISFNAEKIAPNYPLVVGQDPDERGADVRFSASVAPTIYITYEPVDDYGCVSSPGAPGGDGCGVGEELVVTGYSCVEQRITYNECIAFARGTASLSKDSRDWILNELSIRYPGAYLRNPDFSFRSGGACEWERTEEGVQFADPGTWDLSVNGRTSGTPVSAPRRFGGQVSEFIVWLKEIAIVK